MIKPTTLPEPSQSLCTSVWRELSPPQSQEPAGTCQPSFWPRRCCSRRPCTCCSCRTPVGRGTGCSCCRPDTSWISCSLSSTDPGHTVRQWFYIMFSFLLSVWWLCRPSELQWCTHPEIFLPSAMFSVIKTFTWNNWSDNFTQDYDSSHSPKLSVLDAGAGGWRLSYVFQRWFIS